MGNWQSEAVIMQKISEYANSAEMKLVKSSKTTTSVHSETDSKQSKVFLAFKYYYGTLWVSRLEDSDRGRAAMKRMWSIAISEIPMQQVDDGIKKIMMGESKFSLYPPKPGEFAELCRHRRAPSVPEFKGLPSPPVDKEKGRSVISECKRMVRR